MRVVTGPSTVTEPITVVPFPASGGKQEGGEATRSGYHITYAAQHSRNQADSSLKGSKRALRRARNRASRQGETWYKGKLHTLQSLTGASGPRPQSRRTSHPDYKYKPRSRGGNHCRLRVLTLNVGGFSPLLWRGFKDNLDFDLIHIQEVHWAQSSLFHVHGWAVICSAWNIKSAGVITCISPSVDATTIRFEEVVAGRLLRARFEWHGCTIEALNIYQHVWDNKSSKQTNLTRQHSLLEAASRVIAQVPTRATLVVMGDVNAECKRSQGLTGTALARTLSHVGEQARDPNSLTEFVEQHELVAVTTWSSRPPITFQNHEGQSQIDYIFCRKSSADCTAKRADVCSLPFGHWKATGHQPLKASLRCVMYYHHAHRSQKTNVCAGKELDAAVRANDPRAQALRVEVQHALSCYTQQGRLPTPDDINSALRSACLRIFPPQQSRPKQPDAEAQSLWQLRRHMSRPKIAAPAKILRAWKAAAAYVKATQRVRKHCLQAKRQRVAGLLLEAEAAASAHQQRQLYNIVKQLAPWKPRPKIMLKDAEGLLVSHKKEHEILREYCVKLFAPQCPAPPRPGTDMTLLFSAHEVARQLSAVKPGRAVPPDSAPSAPWKACAGIIAGHIHHNFGQLRSTDQVFHSAWTDCHLIWMCKPRKPPCKPENLRPIGLVRPDGWPVWRRPTQKLRPCITSSWPRNMPSSQGGALLTVWLGCTRLSRTQATAGHSGNHFARREGFKPAPCVGGILLSIDVSKAFDCVDRHVLKSAMERVQVPEQLIAAVIALHDTAKYHVNMSGFDSTLLTGRGIKQGCRLAPTLWAIQLVDLPYTGFADDTLGHWRIGSIHDIYRVEQMVRSLFDVLDAFGLTTNPDKCSLIVQLKGKEAKRILKQRSVVHKGAKCWAVPRGGKYIFLPIVDEATYLGAISSFKNPVEKTVAHRVKEANAKAAQIRQTIRSKRIITLDHRVRVWKACVLSSALYGLAPLGPTHQALNML